MPAAARRAGIIEAADAEFAVTGLAGTRLEGIAARAGISHPRIVQVFGSKRELFLEVVHAAFGKIEAAFERAEPTLAGLGAAYAGLLRDEPTVGLVVLQGYAAAADETVRDAVRRRHLGLMTSAARLTGANEFQIRTFYATGLVQTISTALALPEHPADTTWSAWLIDLADPAGREDRNR